MKNILIALVGFVMLAILMPVMGSNVNTFKTGPFTVSVDLGMPCNDANDTNIYKPVSSEDLGGAKYTDYYVRKCNALFFIRQWNSGHLLDLTDPFQQNSIKTDLISQGVDLSTIQLYTRTIDGKSGAAGSGYDPIHDGDVYSAGFYISQKSYCYVDVMGNETEMISALKTIHVTEAAT